MQFGTIGTQVSISNGSWNCDDTWPTNVVEGEKAHFLDIGNIRVEITSQNIAFGWSTGPLFEEGGDRERER